MAPWVSEKSRYTGLSLWDLVLSTNIDQINFCSGRPDKSGFEVLWRSDESLAEMQDLRESLENDWNLEPGECGVDIEGKRHEDSIHCANSSFDDYNGIIFKVKEKRKLSCRLNALRWLPALLDFHWRNGFDEEGIELLERTGLVWFYR